MSNCHFLTLFTPMHTSFLLEVENVVTGSWSPVTKDTYCFLLVLDRVNLRKVTWWVRLSSHILLLTNHWVQAGYACPAWFPRIRVCTKISNSAGRSSQGRWWWKCPTQLENNVPHSSERKLTRLSRLVLLTLNIPNNIQFKDGVQVLKLGTDLLHLERSANSSHGRQMLYDVACHPQPHLMSLCLITLLCFQVLFYFQGKRALSLLWI